MIDLAAHETMLGVFLERADRHPDAIAVEERRSGGADADRALTWSDWRDASRSLAAALIADGVRTGDVVAILAGNRNFWPIADIGVLMAGGVSVGVYPTCAPVQLRALLDDCGAAGIVVDTVAQLEKVQAVAGDLTRLRLIACEADGSWAALLARGAAILTERADVRAEVERRTVGASADDVAILIYTSGSTGVPKGARLPHRYLTASADAVRRTLALGGTDTTLSFLPYCHAGERVFGLYTRILCGMRTMHVTDASLLWPAARAFAPTLFGGLPRFFEKIYEALIVHERSLAGGEREQWTAALAAGRERFAYRRNGTSVPPELEARWQAASAPCRALLAKLLGARLRLATSGGAKLPTEVADYLDAAGLTVLGAYGQTEHLCVAFHRPDRYDAETVGLPMPGTELRIDEDGEVLVRRGPLTFAGYHGKPEETRDAFTPDGFWLRTGDLGELTADGRLRITGRKKELIALSSGKKVAPLPIEARLAEDPWIAHAMVYGEGERFLSALVVPRRPIVEAWQRERGLALGWTELLAHPDVVARVQAVVDRVNADLSSPERIKRFTLLDRELTVEADELTPTMKLRRAVVTERYRDRLTPLYRQDGGRE